MALNSFIIHGFRWFFHGLPWRHCRFSGMTGCDRVLIQFWPQMGLLNFIGPYLARIRMSAGVLGWWWFPMSWPNAAGREWTWGNACLSKVSNIHSLQQRCLAWMIAEMLLCLCSFVIFCMVFMYFMFQWVSFGSDWQGYVLPNQWSFGIGWRYEMVGMVSVGDAHTGWFLGSDPNALQVHSENTSRVLAKIFCIFKVVLEVVQWYPINRTSLTSNHSQSFIYLHYLQVSQSWRNFICLVLLWICFASFDGCIIVQHVAVMAEMIMPITLLEYVSICRNCVYLIFRSITSP